MMKGKIFFLSAIFCLTWQYVGATPVVNNFTSTGIAEGSSATVTGTGFGTKSPAPPLYLANFKNGSLQPTSKGQKTSWGVQKYTLVCTSDTTRRYGNATCMAKVDWINCTGNGDASAAFELDDHVNALYTYVARVSNATNLDGSANIKTWRLNTSAEDGDHDFAQTLSGGGAAYNECNTNQSDRYADYEYAANRMYVESHWWTQGGTQVTETGASGGWRYQQNWQTIQESTKMANCAATHDRLVIAHKFMSDETACPGDKSDWVSYVYIDTTPASVWLANSTNFSTASAKEPQVLRTWGADITFEINMGNLKSTDTISVFVMDSSTAVSSAFVTGSVPGQTNLAPRSFAVTSTSAAFQWTEIGGSENYRYAFSSDNFSTTIASASTSANTISFASLDAGTTYQFKVKLATESDSSDVSHSTLTYRTNLAPFKDTEFSSHDDLLIKWQALTADHTIALVGVSTGVVGVTLGVQATNYFNLTPSTPYTFKIKLSTMGDSDYNSITVMTDAAGGSVSPAPTTRKSGNRGRKGGRSR